MLDYLSKRNMDPKDQTFKGTSATVCETMHVGKNIDSLVEELKRKGSSNAMTKEEYMSTKQCDMLCPNCWHHFLLETVNRPHSSRPVQYCRRRPGSQVFSRVPINKDNWTSGKQASFILDATGGRYIDFANSRIVAKISVRVRGLFRKLRVSGARRLHCLSKVTQRDSETQRVRPVGEVWVECVSCVRLRNDNHAAGARSSRDVTTVSVALHTAN
jgi:hypothetical protein